MDAKTRHYDVDPTNVFEEGRKPKSVLLGSVCPKPRFKTDDKESSDARDRPFGSSGVVNSQVAHAACFGLNEDPKQGMATNVKKQTVRNSQKFQTENNSKSKIEIWIIFLYFKMAGNLKH